MVYGQRLPPYKVETIYFMSEDFSEIGHSGGKVIFNILTDKEGRTGYQIEQRHESSGPVVLTGVYALPQGIPVDFIQLGGIGQPWNRPPYPNCLAVLMASDSQGRFGHKCPQCNGYWRSGPRPNICPYCALYADNYHFLSEAQRRYIEHYCEVLLNALDDGGNRQVVIDMDAVAQATRQGEKPAFYLPEESQQCKFTCAACEEFNDILGRFGYCSSCGTRNDLEDFNRKSIPALRERLKSGAAAEDCAKDAVSAFDTYMGQIARQLVDRVPMTPPRQRRLSQQAFHDLSKVREIFKNWFDIDISAGISDDDFASINRMFLRRHIYEHNGGEVDQRYLDESKDTTVRLRQHIHETPEDTHKFLTALSAMAKNAHIGFHELFPPLDAPIMAHNEKLERMRNYQRG